MLFNSFEFLLGFLPMVLAVFYFLGRTNQRVAAAWLVAASLFFYGWWNPNYVLLLIVSMTLNFSFGLALARAVRSGSPQTSRTLLVVAIASNLVVLSYFKYAGFVLANIATLTHARLLVEGIVLPLGISFFTFTQIAFLVDTYRGHVREFNPVHYALFVTYFPHLIAGPVLHHKEMMPQFARSSVYRLDAENIAVGLTAFIIGLFKKVVLADGIAVYATPVFNAAKAGVHLTLFEAWGGVLAYTFQIYFDFSGNSDMAVGLSCLFGVRLPINFYSPYQARSITDFWRRWHMTLSRFLRDYLYIPLGGNRKGPTRRYVNLIVTMLLGGLWHGAGWTFVIWGGLHGAYLAVNQGWRGRSRTMASAPWTGASIALTFFAVAVAWVFFRAPTLPVALDILTSMFGLRGVSLPSDLASAQWLAAAGVRFDGMFHHNLAPWSFGTAWLAALAAITWFAPNTHQILESFRPTLDGDALQSSGARWRWYRWAPALTHATFIAALCVTALAWMLVGTHSEFLYFQF